MLISPTVAVDLKQSCGDEEVDVRGTSCAADWHRRVLC